MAEKRLEVVLKPEGPGPRRGLRPSRLGRVGFYLSLAPALAMCVDTIFHPG